MSNPENFLQRWSRRKLASAESPAPSQPSAEQEHTENVSARSAPARQDAAAGRDETEPFDLASLPSMESIDAGSDVIAFLQPGVPPDLTRAALRRAWTSDPAIRDFVGLVENGWDFNKPDAMSGFGAISAEEVVRLVSRVITQLPAATPPAAAAHAEEGALLLQNERADGIEGRPQQADPSSKRENDAVQKKPDI